MSYPWHIHDADFGADEGPEEPDDCYQCGGEGEIEVDCGEDSCCCAEPHAVIPCPMCSQPDPQQKAK